MKILFITPSFHPNIGGVEKHVLNLSLSLIKMGNGVTVLTEKNTSDKLDHEIYENINIVRVNVVGISQKNKKWTIWKWMIINRSFLNKFDVIHVHDVVFWMYPIKLINPGLKFYTTFHGWEGQYPIPFKNILQRKINSLLSKRNISVGDYLIKWYKYKSDLIIYGAV